MCFTYWSTKSAWIFAIVVQIELSGRAAPCQIDRAPPGSCGASSEAGAENKIPNNHALVGGVDEVEVGGPGRSGEWKRSLRESWICLFSLAMRSSTGCNAVRASLVDGVLIHAGRVVVAHLLLHRRPVGRGLRRLFQRVVHGGNVPDGRAR